MNTRRKCSCRIGQTSSQRSARYELLRRFPQASQYLIEAICGSTQFMGKGMSVAASQAVQLETTLASGDHETASTKAFFLGSQNR